MPESQLAKHRVDHLHYMSPLENAPGILQVGILSYNSANGVSHHSIALWDVQRRREAAIPGTKRRIHDYVPLYFATHTPMQYVITRSAPTVRDNEVISQHNLVFFEVDAEKVFSIPGTIFTDGNAASKRTAFYTKLADLANLDWDAIASPNAYPQCYQWEWKRRKSSEVLVPDHVPVNIFSRVVVYSEQALERLKAQLASLGGSVGKQGLGLRKSPLYVDRSHYF